MEELKDLFMSEYTMAFIYQNANACKEVVEEVLGKDYTPDDYEAAYNNAYRKLSIIATDHANEACDKLFVEQNKR